VHSGEHIAMTAGQHLSLSVGKRFLASAMQGIRLFAQSMGIKMFAAKGKVEIQAQSDNIEIIADQVLKLISAKKSIEIAAAEEILLTAKGSYIKINGNGIEHGTLEGFTVYSASKNFTGPKSLASYYEFKKVKGDFKRKLVLQDDAGHIMPNHWAEVTRENGSKQKALSNNNGEVELYINDMLENLKIHPFEPLE
jgi:type VI secretion system secreted protein VgrG